MRRRIIFAIIAILVLAGLVVVLNRKTVHTTTVGIIEPMVHIAVSDVTRGIEDGLRTDGDHFSILVKNANGDSSTIPQIIAQYRDAGVNIFVPIFTTTAQATKSSVDTNIIVFAAVTDPVVAGLVTNPKAPDGNITGVSDLWPIGANFNLIKKILPNASRMGILFDPNDPSSSATMPLIREYAKQMGFVLVEKPVHSATDVAEALPVLKEKIDLIFTADDVTVTKSFSALVAYAIENKIPLFAGDYSSVQRGAVAAVGQNYYDVGRDTAKVIIAVTHGTLISSLPVQYTGGGDVYVNLAAAEKMGVSIPDSVRQEAKEAYSNITEGEPK
jgi:putative ABC transport system substrate-binding protein